MKRTTPPRSSYAYIVQPTNKLDLREPREPNELGESLPNLQAAPTLTVVPAMRLLARRRKRQRRFG